MFYCTKCGTANSRKANYCIHDGYPLHKPEAHFNINHIDTISCDNCGADRMHGAIYCHACGETYEHIRTREVDHSKASIPFKKNDVKQGLIKTFPFAILAVLILWFGSYLSLNDVQPTNFDHSEINPEVELVNQYRFMIDRYEQMNLQAKGDNRTFRMGESTEDRVSSLSPVDVMMLSNLASVHLTYQNDSVSGDPELVRNQESRAGLVYYLFLAMLSIAIAGFIYMKWARLSNWKAIITHLLSFGLWYSVIIFLISLMVTYSSEDANFEVTYSYSYISIDALWTSFIISLVALSFVFLYQRHIRFPHWLRAVRLSLTTFMILILVFLGVTTVFYLTKLQSVQAFEMLQGIPLVSSLVIIAQVAVILLNLVFMNSFQFSAKGDISEAMSYHLIQKINGDAMPEEWFQGFMMIEGLLWALVGIAFIILLWVSYRLSTLTLVNRLKQVIIYSLSFTFVMTLISRGATMYFENLTPDYDGWYEIGFGTLQTLVTFFVITFVITLLGSFLFTKVRSGDKHEQTDLAA
ncbi:zinc ribbon domain-containing protein [Tenuibacillus multivorans]|uniref:Double zinc ribbon n=1 Tax=Tenuibacillus multivorans TaxID=237069 RepID=A0A1H0EK65_9BACI|nr:zinc ribbon domain-containing protein [Tenuibacillus multivorans]GEL77125.1 hypothetical protein TMU01_13600 [Tenuibacillus multivorans]SDN82730.1 Double zinc ribbon [Tenuibacillus multivorans]